MDINYRNHLISLIHNATKFNCIADTLKWRSTMVDPAYTHKDIEDLIESADCYVNNKAYEGDGPDVRFMDGYNLNNAAKACGLLHERFYTSRKVAGPFAVVVPSLDLVIIGGNPMPSVLATAVSATLTDFINEVFNDLGQQFFQNDIREMWWNPGTLNKNIKEALDKSTLEQPLLDWRLNDGNYEDLVTYMVKNANGWPTTETKNPFDFDTLKQHEKDKVNAFDANAYITKLAEAVKEDPINNAYRPKKPIILKAFEDEEK